MRAACNNTKVPSHEGEQECMNRRKLFALAIAATGFAPLAPTRGETTNAITSIVVEATRLESGIMETPQFVETFSKDEIRESGARDIMDALERNASVFVRHIGGGNPAMTQVSMRGYGENSIGRVLVKADGEILNNFDMNGSDFSRFPLSSVERIEVLHGPQTVMHGGNASAGMINIITEKPGYDEEGFVEFRGGSWETFGASAGLKGGDAEEMVSYHANGAWDHSQGWRDSSGYDLYRLNGGVRKDFDGGSFVKLSSFFSDSEYELPGPLTFAEWKCGRRDADPDYSFYNYRQTSYGVNFSAKGVIDDENEIKFETTLSHRRDHFRAYQRTDGYLQDSPFDNYALSMTPQYVNIAALGRFDNEFTAGGTLRWDVRKGCNSYAYPTYVWRQKEDQSRWTMGGFTRDELFLSDSFSVFGGARLERQMTDSESLRNPSRNDNLSAFEAGVNCHPVEDAKIFAKFARFYRTPFIDEVSYTSGNLVSPERGWSMDIGGEVEFLDEFSAGGEVYVSETKNEIYYDPFRFDNFNLPGRTRREGIDLRLGWKREKTAQVALSYGFVNARVVDGDYDNKDVCAVPAHRAALNARWHLMDELSVRAGCRYTGEQYTISDLKNEYRKLKGYVLFSLGLEYEFAFEPLKGLVLAFDVDNLFDRDYCDYATYGANFYPAAGRSFNITIRWTF